MEEKKKTAREIIEGYDGPPVRIMEVCGTHTHEIFRLGIRKLLPEQVELISGPGCPVCVTQVGFIDEAIYLALERQVTICTFGDLVRVPGTNMSLAGAREKGAKIRIVYSSVDAKEYAKEHPKEQVTFLSVGFETTTPSVLRTGKRRSQRCGSRIYSKRTFDSAGSGTGTVSGRQAIFCKLLSACSNREWKPTGAEAGRRDDGTLR